MFVEHQRKCLVRQREARVDGLFVSQLDVAPQTRRSYPFGECVQWLYTCLLYDVLCKTMENQLSEFLWSGYSVTNLL